MYWLTAGLLCMCFNTDTTYQSITAAPRIYTDAAGPQNEVILQM